MWNNDTEVTKTKKLFTHIGFYSNKTNDMWLVFPHYNTLCSNEAAFIRLRLNKISYKIDENVHDPSEVSDDGRGREEQAVGHDLQIELDAHEDHKNVLPDLKQRARGCHNGICPNLCSSEAIDPSAFNTCSVGTCMTLVKGDSNIMEIQEQMVTTIITQSK